MNKEVMSAALAVYRQLEDKSSDADIVCSLYDCLLEGYEDGFDAGIEYAEEWQTLETAADELDPATVIAGTYNPFADDEEAAYDATEYGRGFADGFDIGAEYGEDSDGVTVLDEYEEELQQRYDVGHASGFIEGVKQSDPDGQYRTGYRAGSEAGYDEGYAAGYEAGHAAGYDERAAEDRTPF